MCLLDGIGAPRPGAVAALLAMLVTSSAAGATQPGSPPQTAPAEAGAAPGQALGLTIDLLPIGLSLAAGKPGASAQLWYGLEQLRLRGVYAHLALPDSMGPGRGFLGYELDATAVIVDAFLWRGFQGPWLGVGVEHWWQSIGHDSSPGQRVGYRTAVATLGAGWVFPVWEGLFLEPWGAVHVPANTARVSLGEQSFNPPPLQAEVSLKVGWMWGW